MIVHSELLLNYLQKNYPDLYLISSTTKVLTDFQDFLTEINREDFRYIVPDFRLNKVFDKLDLMSQHQKDKVEFLCNECCWFGCKTERLVMNPSAGRISEILPRSFTVLRRMAVTVTAFPRQWKSRFISVDDIQNIYMPMGFSNFKIEGRGLGSALILEFLLYYMTKPEYQLHVREEIYLDNMLDLF